MVLEFKKKGVSGCACEHQNLRMRVVLSFACGEVHIACPKANHHAFPDASPTHAVIHRDAQIGTAYSGVVNFELALLASAPVWLAVVAEQVRGSCARLVISANISIR